MATIPDDTLLSEIARQATEHDTADRGPYQHPEHPEELVSLILQSAAARYDCYPAAAPSERENHPLDVDWNRIRQVVSHITISAENMVVVTFR